ncbi:phenylacetate--CoA ligase family protein [Heliorestis acidaminivorans]|uniref:Phenylacetate--CoA ligase family protein n=1 Tax=Heliorestis acidaminivorans TaxID=553427 RepID=A0A6I0F0E5_9FIRM|nr:AMP-binding protein [Heliorestis acidaminivorans]KAB2951563.1 phenylacetate--CoA ligase family protein [Heliorestis acidaminivorans]
MNFPFEKLFQRTKSVKLLKKYFKGPDVEQMSLNKLQAFQIESMQKIISRTYKRSPFYQEKMKALQISPDDIKTLDDLRKMPFTTKEDLRQDPWALLNCEKKDLSIVHLSTGTTGGKQIYVMHSWRDFYLHDLAPGYDTLVPVVQGDVCLNALPYEMSSAGLAFHKIFINSCWATVIPAGKGGAYSSPEKTVEIMKDLQPTVAVTTPSYAITLAENAQAAGLDLRALPLKKLWLTGEGCAPSFRERVEALWGSIANFYYGSLECGVMGIECDSHEGYHIPLSHCLLEIIDPESGEVLEPGEIGEIVVTCLLRYDSPLIRYRTQDLGYITEDVCSCGISLPRLFLRGRRVDQIILNEEEFSPFYIEEFLMQLPEVGNWYHLIVKPGNNEVLKIRTELAPGITASEELAEKLSSNLEFSIGVPCEFDFVDHLPRSTGKTVRVIQEGA